MPISGTVRQGSPNPILRPAPRRQRPDHRPTAAARAVEAERAELRAWLHDRVLQHLEYLAAGGYADAPDAAALMRVAAEAAEELRAYVDGDEAEAPRDLAVALTQVAADARLLATGTQIRVVVGPEAAELSQPAVDALAGATREALANVAKHARAGFDPAATPFGCGLRHSVLGRLTAVGGTATLDSSPGAGTRLTFTVPLPEPTAPEVVA